MVVLGTGTVTFTDIKNAFGGAATNINLGRYYKGGSYVTNGNEPAIPRSGNPLSVSTLRGRSANLSYTASYSVTHPILNADPPSTVSYSWGTDYVYWYFTHSYTYISSSVVYFTVEDFSVTNARYSIIFWYGAIIPGGPRAEYTTGGTVVTGNGDKVWSTNNYVSPIEIHYEVAANFFRLTNVRVQYTSTYPTTYVYS